MGLFTRLSYVSRKRKLDLFYGMLRPSEKVTILDIGAEINPLGDRGLQLIDSYPWKKNITAINLSADDIRRIQEYYPEIDGRVGDARDLPWPDKYFDIVYSNAVIEHVGDLSRQKKMASEIMRVGRSWFVTTPNRWYPFEFHLRLPFVTWLPFHGYLKVGRLVRYNHLAKKYVFWNGRISGTRLMKSRELNACFPESHIVRMRVTFMAETLIAIGGEGVKMSRKGMPCFDPPLDVREQEERCP